MGIIINTLDFVDRLFLMHSSITHAEYDPLNDKPIYKIFTYTAYQTQCKFGFQSKYLSTMQKVKYELIAGMYYYFKLKQNLKKYLKKGIIPPDYENLSFYFGQRIEVPGTAQDSEEDSENEQGRNDLFDEDNSSDCYDGF